MTRWRPAHCPLPTRWTATVDPDNVWPEHPRPQLVRPQWQSLNGVYECSIQPLAAAPPTHFEATILVPFPVESALSGMARRVTATDRIWYRRSFHVDTAPDGHTWMLHFGAVDWRTEVWVNRRPLGSHEGGFDPFSFSLGPLGGDHELVIAVWDPTDDGPQPRGKQALHPPRLMRPFFYTPASGIWQTVWLELVPSTHVAALRLTPKLGTDGDTLSIDAQLAGAYGDEEVCVLAMSNGRHVATTEGRLGDSPLQLSFTEPRRWTPDDPFLYDLEVRVRRRGKQMDAARSYCGLRDIRLQRDSRGALRFALNGKPLFLHGLLDQGYWPDGIYTAPSDEALRCDLEETKRLGFNLVRKHVKIEPARWYWHCDRLGLLVFQDMPNGDRMTRGIPLGGVGIFDPTRWLGERAIRRTPSSAAIYERELVAMLAALAHHPSIVMWVPFNEGWGQFDAARIAALVQASDHTRLVDAASGWIDPGTGDVRDVHVYYPGPRMPARPDPRRADVLGEWGGLGLVIDTHCWPKKPFAYRILKSAADFESAYAEQLAQLRILAEKGLAAAVWTQTTDVEGEVNGLFTYDRSTLKLDATNLCARNLILLKTV